MNIHIALPENGDKSALSLLYKVAQLKEKAASLLVESATSYEALGQRLETCDPERPNQAA